MYIPAWPSLNPALLVRPRVDGNRPFPLETPGSSYFYVARNAIYHLMRALRLGPGDVVLAPDYHHGNEILAMKATGIEIRYYPVQKNLDADVDALARLCEVEPRPRALYVTHFIGWPQPLDVIQSLCRDKRLLLIEDCALSFMSDYDRKPLGTFGDYSVFCLYKSLPLPNGGVLVRNSGHDEGVELQPCSALSVVSRSTELTLHWLRTRSDACGRALLALKRTAGMALNLGNVRRNPVGNTGFDIQGVNVRMSSLCHRLLCRFQYEQIKEARRRNFQILADRLRERVTVIDRKLSDGVCPLFFPLLVKNKHYAADLLLRRGIETIEFWNAGDTEAYQSESAAAFLRRHLLEIPIHQDVTPEAAGFISEEIVKLGQSL